MIRETFQSMKNLINISLTLFKAYPIYFTLVFIYCFGVNLSLIRNKPFFRSLFWFLPIKKYNKLKNWFAEDKTGEQK